MPEVSVGPALSAGNAFDKGGDADYLANAMDWEQDTISVGRFGGKSPANEGIGSEHAFPMVPLLSKANKAKVEVYPTSTDIDGGFSLKIGVIGGDARLREVDRQNHDAQFNYLPDWGVFPVESMWDEGDLGTGDRVIEHKLSIEHGMGRYGQIFECDVSGKTLHGHYWNLKRVGSATGSTFRTRLYTVTGSPGAYYRDTLIDDGIARTCGDITTGGGSIPNGLLAGQALDLGTLYCAELEILGGSGSDAIQIQTRRNQANGAFSNSYIEAQLSLGRQLKGFGGHALWMDGADFNDVAAMGTEDTITCPDMTSGTLYGFGHADYSGANFTVLPNFTAAVQAALDARVSLTDRIAVRFYLDGSWVVDSRQRTWRSSRNASPTTAGEFGMVFTLDFTAPIPQVISLVGSGTSKVELVGSGTSKVAKTGAGTSKVALVGTGTSKVAKQGTGTSKVSLVGNSD